MDFWRIICTSSSGIYLAITSESGDIMKMKCNNRLLRLSASLTLISLVVTAANANNGRGGDISRCGNDDERKYSFRSRSRPLGESAGGTAGGSAEAQIDEARSGWMPQIALNGSTGHSQTTDSSGSLRNSAASGPESDAAGVRFWQDQQQHQPVFSSA